MGVIVKKEPCPKCRAKGDDRSGDNLNVYAAGQGAHCFRCGYTVRSDSLKQEGGVSEKTDFSNVEALPSAGLQLRGISAEVAREFGVRVEYDQESGSEYRYYFPVYRGPELVAYQCKPANEPGKRKDAGHPFFLGDAKGEVDPFGSARGGRAGKFIIAVEGAEDALATVELLKHHGKKWRVVATLGTERWKKMIDFFAGFAKVVIAFDQDDAGQTAARAFAEALGPGQGCIATWTGGANDPNDLLRAGHFNRFLKAVNEAKPIRPDGIITGEEVWRRMETYTAPDSIPYPAEWEILNAKMLGMRRGEISLWTAGTGVGKTSFVRRLKQHVLSTTDWRIGEIELEEAPEKTWRGLMEFQAGKRWKDCSPDEKRSAYDMTYGTQRIATLNHRSQFGKGQTLLGKLKFLHYGMGADFIVLDHITLAVAEFGEGEGIVAQDRMMADFLSFVESTNCHLCIISHLRKSPAGGRSFEEGAMPTMDDLKGSGSIKQISFDIVGLARNQQADDEYERNTTQLGVLKCREEGNTGMADRMYWNRDTRQLEKAKPPAQEDEGDERQF